MSECVFCDIAAGHMLIIPRRHVPDFSTDAAASAAVMARAAEIAGDFTGPVNLIASRGAAATQTVNHLHLHLVPRRAGDGLALPWTARRDTTQSTLHTSEVTHGV